MMCLFLQAANYANCLDLPKLVAKAIAKTYKGELPCTLLVIWSLRLYCHVVYQPQGPNHYCRQLGVMTCSLEASHVLVSLFFLSFCFAFLCNSRQSSVHTLTGSWLCDLHIGPQEGSTVANDWFCLLCTHGILAYKIVLSSAGKTVEEFRATFNIVVCLFFLQLSHCHPVPVSLCVCAG
jgi:hypothetical protein